MANYDFRLDLSVAQKTEKQVKRFLLNKFSGLEYIGGCSNEKYDLKFDLKGHIFTVEIKEDFMCSETGNVGVEYSCRGKDSGIKTTKATYYLYKIHEPEGVRSLYWIQTRYLRGMIRDGLYHRTVSGGDAGSGTKCYLFYLSTVKEYFRHLGNVD